MRKLLNFKIVLVFVSVVVIVCIASVQANPNASQSPNYNPFDSGFHLAPLPGTSHNYIDPIVLPPPFDSWNVFPNDDKISGNASDRAKWVTNIVIPSRVRHRSPCHPGS